MPARILYARLPGLLALAARAQSSCSDAMSLAVVTGKTVRDACHIATKQAVRSGENVARARRLCPLLLTVPLEEINHQALTIRFLEVLEPLTPTIEPEGPDAKGKKTKPMPGQEAFALTIPPLLPSGMSEFVEGERFSQEWKALGFSPSGHPMHFYRTAAEEAGALPCAALQQCRHGEVVLLAGLCLRPHRPPTPSGEVIVFLTLEDETGLAQVTVLPSEYASGGAIFGHFFLFVRGRVETRGGGNSLIAEEVTPLAF